MKEIFTQRIPPSEAAGFVTFPNVTTYLPQRHYEQLP